MFNEAELWPASDPPPRNPLIGRVIAYRYEILELLGKGGMGTVFRVRDLKSPAADEYAMKTLVSPTERRPAQIGRFDRRARFTHEFRMGQEARSGRIIRTYDHDASLENGTEMVFYTMNLVPGGCVPEVTAPQPPELVAALGLELLAALDELHSHTIVHRDIKPANILLAHPWRTVRDTFDKVRHVCFPTITLSDLGIARHGSMSADNPVGQMQGTRRYLPPEFHSLGNLDPRADLWAVGVILYQMAVGEHPMIANGYPVSAVIDEWRDFSLESPKALVGFPGDLSTAIMQLLARDPTKRTATAARAYEAVFEWWHKERRHLRLPAQPIIHGKPYLSTPRFVGRQEELRAVRRFLLQTLEFRTPEPLGRETIIPDYREYARMHLPPSVLAISGESGTGKSRLLHEVVRLARQMGAHVLISHGMSGIGQSMRLISQGLANLEKNCLVRSTNGTLASVSVVDELDALSTTETNTNTVGERLPRRAVRTPDPGRPEYRSRIERAEDMPVWDDENIATLGTREAALRLFMRNNARMLRAAGLQPLLIVLEDCQWADPSSLALLEYLVAGVPLARMLGHPACVAFVVTHRPGGSAVERLQHILSAQANYEQAPIRIQLDGISKAECNEMVASLLQINPSATLTRWTASLFADKTRPFDIETTLQYLLEEGELTSGKMATGTEGRWDGTWRLDSDSTRRPPANIQDSIGQHVCRLSAGTQRLLGYGATMGRRFDLATVARATGYEPSACLGFLDEAASASLVVEAALTGEAAMAQTRRRTFCFRHDRYFESIYESLDEDQQQVYHRRLADAIEDLHGQDPAAAEELTRHLERSGQFDRAHDAAIRAAQYMENIKAHDQAAEFYQRAIELAERVNKKPPSVINHAYGCAAVSAGLFATAAKQFLVRLNDGGLSEEEARDTRLRLANLAHQQRDFENAQKPLIEWLDSMGETIPQNRIVRAVAARLNLLVLLLCGLFPGIIKRSLNTRPKRSVVVSQAWYQLAECSTFSDFGLSMFVASKSARQAVRAGHHSYSPPIFAQWAWVFGAVGWHWFSRTYSRLVTKMLSGKPAVDSTPAAIAHFLLFGGRVFRGEISSWGTDVRNEVHLGVLAAKQSGDPQRLWILLVWIAEAHLMLGHVNACCDVYTEIITHTTSRRLSYLTKLYESLRDGMLARSAGRLPETAAAFGRVADLAEENSDVLMRIATRMTSNLAIALNINGGDIVARPDLPIVVADEISEWLKRKMQASCWPLGEGLAILALCQLHQDYFRPLDPRVLARLRRRCRKPCMANRVETPLYFGACAAFDLLDGKHKRAKRGFEAAAKAAHQYGMIAPLLDVYRLAVRVCPPGRERRMYSKLEAQLSDRIVSCPSLPIGDLLAGARIPPIEIPQPMDYSG